MAAWSHYQVRSVRLLQAADDEGEKQVDKVGRGIPWQLS